MVIGELELINKGVSEYLKEYQGAGRLCRYRVLLETVHISRKVLTIFSFVCLFVSHEGNRDLKFGQAATVPRFRNSWQLCWLYCDNFARTNNLERSDYHLTKESLIFRAVIFFTGITAQIFNWGGFLTANVSTSNGPEGYHNRVIERYRGQLAELACAA